MPFPYGSWTPACPARWNKHVLVYGDAELKKDHPVLAYFIKEGKCATLSWYRDG